MSMYVGTFNVTFKSCYAMLYVTNIIDVSYSVTLSTAEIIRTSNMKTLTFWSNYVSDVL